MNALAGTIAEQLPPMPSMRCKGEDTFDQKQRRRMPCVAKLKRGHPFRAALQAATLDKEIRHPWHLERGMHVELVVPPHILDCVTRRLPKDTCDNLVRLLYATQECEAGGPIAKCGRNVGLFTKYSSCPIQHLFVIANTKVGDHVSHIPGPRSMPAVAYPPR